MSSARDVFIGREAELSRFRKALPIEQGMAVFSIVGPGGIGKTWLLQQMVRVCEDKRILNTGIIDLFDASVRTRVGVLNTVLQRLGQHVLSADEIAERPWLDEVQTEELRSRDLLSRFQRRIGRLGNRRLVLFFDTFELVSGSPLESWFVTEFLPALGETAVVAVAGRPPGLQVIPDELPIQLMELEPFGFLDVENLFSALELDSLVTEAELQRVYQLTKGELIQLALVCDLLLRGITRVAFEELLTTQREDFREHLVDWMMHATDRAEQIILYMAHLVYLPMDAPMLADLSGWPLTECEAILDQVGEFSFVRALGDQGYILHDEMRRLVNETVWEVTDAGQTVRRKLSLSLVEHFGHRLEALQEPAGGITETRSLSIRLARLYHLLFGEHPQAYQEFWQIVDEHWLSYRFDTMATAIQIAEQCQANRIEGDPTLRGLAKAFAALLHLEGPNWETEALECAKAARQTAPATRAPDLIGALADYAVGTWFSLQGDIEKAEQHLETAIDALERVNQKLAEGPSPDGAVVPSSQAIYLKLYEVHNTLGFVQRRGGRFAEAAAHYEKALYAAIEARREAKGQPASEVGLRRMEASSRNNLARSLLLLGRLGKARYWCLTGLQTLESLEMDGPLGHSYNVLGLIYREEGRLPEAAQNFQEAIQLLTTARYSHGLGVATRNLGWVRLQEGLLDEAESCFRKAQKLLVESPLESELADLYHGMGRLQLEQAVREGQDPTEARVTFQKAYQLAHQYQQMHVLARVCVDRWRIAYGDTTEQQHWEEEIRRLQGSYQFHAVYAEFEFLLGMAAEEANDLHQAAHHFVKAFHHWGQHNVRVAERRLGELAVYLVGLDTDRRSTLAAEMGRLVHEVELHESILPTFLAVCEAYGSESLPAHATLQNLP